MPSKSIPANQPEQNAHTIPPTTVCSEQWWRAAGYDPYPLANAGEGAPKLTFPDRSVEVTGSKDDQSLSHGGDDDDETSKDSETTGSTSTHRDGSSGHDLQKSQYGDSSMALGNGECFSQHPPLELVGHSIACATTPYPDLYYGGMMAAYGHQPLVRAKAELEKKLIKVRKPYLHESRHQHALRRARGSGGRFAKKGEAESSNHSADEENKASDGGGSQSHKAHGEHSGRSIGLGERGEGQSNQQWGNMSSDQAPKCALAI